MSLNRTLRDTSHGPCQPGPLSLRDSSPPQGHTCSPLNLSWSDWTIICFDHLGNALGPLCLSCEAPWGQHTGSQAVLSVMAAQSGPIGPIAGSVQVGMKCLASLLVAFPVIARDFLEHPLSGGQGLKLRFKRMCCLNIW